MVRRRRPVAIACIALVVVAALLPLGGVSLDWIVVPDTFVLLEWLTPAGALVEQVPPGSPASPCFRSIDPRGPPSPSLV